MNPTIRNAMLAAAVAAVFAAGLWWFNYIPDDAYIGMRYARNVAEGKGLVFNPGERVEGYTDFLWIMILAAAVKAGVPLVVGSRVLSLLFSVGTLILSWRACDSILTEKERGLAGPGVAAAAPLILAASAPFMTWALSGTEIPLFTFLLTAGMLLLLTGHGPRSVFTVFAVLTLVRPEGAAWYILAGALLVARGERPRRVAAGGILIASLLLAPYVIWKTLYFGSVLPNTFYAKTGAQAVQLRNGAAYTMRFAAWYIWLPAASVFFFLTGGRRASRRRGDFGRLTVPLSFIALNWTIVTAFGGDWMPQFRLLVPSLPAIAIMAAAAIPGAAAFAAAGGDKAPSHRTTAWLSAAVAAIFASVAMAPASSGYEDLRRERLVVRAFGWVGEILGDRLPEGTVLGCGSTGAIGYYSGLPVVDILGLTEPEIARKGKIVSSQPGHMKALGSYVLDRKPDLLLLGNVQIHRGRRQEDLEKIKVQEMDIVLDPRFSVDYRFVNLPLGGGFFLSCYSRSGSAVFSE
jgi:arabinofuranosyltransferase